MFKMIRNFYPNQDNKHDQWDMLSDAKISKVQSPVTIPHETLYGDGGQGLHAQEDVGAPPWLLGVGEQEGVGLIPDQEPVEDEPGSLVAVSEYEV